MLIKCNEISINCKCHLVDLRLENLPHLLMALEFTFIFTFTHFSSKETFVNFKARLS